MTAVKSKKYKMEALFQPSTLEDGVAFLGADAPIKEIDDAMPNRTDTSKILDITTEGEAAPSLPEFTQAELVLVGDDARALRQGRKSHTDGMASRLCAAIADRFGGAVVGITTYRETLPESDVKALRIHFLMNGYAPITEVMPRRITATFEKEDGLMQCVKLHMRKVKAPAATAKPEAAAPKEEVEVAVAPKQTSEAASTPSPFPTPVEDMIPPPVEDGKPLDGISVEPVEITFTQTGQSDMVQDEPAADSVPDAPAEPEAPSSVEEAAAPKKKPWWKFW
ncbi:MAG: hypothetical protein ABJN42_24755 [Roseibium sp.]|uniref:hypothetical protein n=1 Tax=Roseibium sp. TaxID=1936156 RepID=UPI003299BA9B